MGCSPPLLPDTAVPPSVQDGTKVGLDHDAVIQAVKSAESEGVQVVTAAILGHKADVGFMALGRRTSGDSAASSPTFRPPA